MPASVWHALDDVSRKNTDGQVLHGTVHETTLRGHTVMFWRAGGEAEGGAALDCTSGRTHPGHLHLHDDRYFIPSRLPPASFFLCAYFRNTLFSHALRNSYAVFKSAQAIAFVVHF